MIIVAAIDQSFASDEEKVALKTNFWGRMDAIQSQYGVIKGLEELKAEPVEMDMSLLYVM